MSTTFAPTFPLRPEPKGARRGRMQRAAKRRIPEVLKRAVTPQTAEPRPIRRRGDSVHGLLATATTWHGSSRHFASGGGKEHGDGAGVVTRRPEASEHCVSGSGCGP